MQTTIASVKAEIEKLSVIVATDPTQMCEVAFPELKAPFAGARTLLDWYWGLLESMIRRA